MDEREARKCLAAALTAGQTAGQWAQAHGIDGRSLNMWGVNLSRRGADQSRGRPAVIPARPARPPRVALVELVPAPAPASPPKTETAGLYTVVVGDLRLEVGNDVDAAALRRVIEVLRTC